MKKTSLVIITIALTFILVLPLVDAQGLLIKPAKLGTYRVTIPVFGDFVAEKNFTIGNRYDYDLNVTITPTGNFSDIVEYEPYSVVMAPNENRSILYTLRISEPGYYGGGFVLKSFAQGKPAQIAYLAEINVFAYESSVPSVLYPTVLLIVLASVGYIFYHKYSKRKLGKRPRILFFMVLTTFLLTVSSVSASDVALIVKDRTSLDQTHEQRINDILVDMGHDVTLIDGTVSFNYNNFDLIVVAGRPSGGSIGDFVKTIPTTQIPTIAIDSSYLDDWGWTRSAGTSSVTSSDRAKVYIQESHPISNGFILGQKVYVHLISGKPLTDLVAGRNNLTSVGTIREDGKLAVIAYANPNTILANGKQVGNKAAIVFFGVHFPNLWTEDAVKLFKNSVTWLTTLDFTPPSIPELSAAWKKGDTSIAYSWNLTNEANAVKYELQVSNDPNFVSLLTTQITTSKTFSFSPITETKTYYGRVRAYNNINIYGNWSSVTKTVIDSTDMIITFVSPTPGISVFPGSSVFTDVTLKAPKMINGYNCSIYVNDQFVANLTYNSTKSSCSGNVVLPSTTGTITYRASATNSLGSTNSTSIQFTVSAPSSGSSSSSSSSGGGSYSIAILGIEVAKEFTATEDSDLEINVNAKNEGLVPLTAVKLTVVGVDFVYEVTPELISLDLGQSQQFTIILHIPENSQGLYNLEIRGLSLEANTKKKVVLNVEEKPLLPNVIIDGKQIPVLAEGEPAAVSISLTNNGDADADGVVKLTVPEGWVVDVPEQLLLLVPGESEIYSFTVTPVAGSGRLIFEISYERNGRTETIVDTAEVTAEERFNLLDISGFVSFITSPLVGIPLAILAAATVGYYFRAELLRNIFSLLNSIRTRPVSAPSEKTFPTPGRVDYKKNYERWERKYRLKQ